MLRYQGGNVYNGSGDKPREYMVLAWDVKYMYYNNNIWYKW